MAQFAMMPLWTDALVADTTDLSTAEFGAYMLILVAMWRKGGALPDDDRKLANITRLSPKAWASVRPAVMDLVDVKDGQITQGRLLDEIEAARQSSARQSRKAKARWAKYHPQSAADENPPGDQKSQNGSPRGKGIVDPDETDNPLEDNEPGNAAAYAVSMPDLCLPSPILKVSSRSVPMDGESGAADRTDREALLAALGADPTSGIVGPNGKRFGTQSDQAVFDRWRALGLTIPQQIEVIREVRARGKAASSVAYFTPAMEERAKRNAAERPTHVMRSVDDPIERITRENGGVFIPSQVVPSATPPAKKRNSG